MMRAWKKRRLGDCLELASLPVRIQDHEKYRQLTVAMHGRGVRLRQVIKGSEIKTKSQYIARAGQFIYSRLDARNGAMGIVPDPLDGAVVSNDFPTFNIKSDVVDAKFLAYLTQRSAFEAVCEKASRGVTNRQRLKEEEFSAIEISLPSTIEEQRRILKRIHSVSARASEASRLQAILDEERDELLFALLEQMKEEATWAPMGEVAPIIRRSICIEHGREYPEIGVKSFGRGTFHTGDRERAIKGWARLFRIEPNDLLISNLMAWEGAVAVAQAHDAGTFGNHRMLTCAPDLTRVSADWLCCYFLSPEGMRKIQKASPASIKRNRTIGTKKLAAIEVPIPSPAALKLFNEVYRRTQEIRRQQVAIAKNLESIMPAVLDMAFRGEL